MAALCRRFVPLVQKITPRLLAPTARITCNHGLPDNDSFLIRRFSSTMPSTQKETVSLKFSLADGRKETVKAAIGENLLDVILENNIDIDGFGACEGTLACSTCHLIFKQVDYDKLPETPTDEELDMLDLAYSLTDTSRLGCQVIVSKEMENWEIRVPAGVADARDV